MSTPEFRAYGLEPMHHYFNENCNGFELVLDFKYTKATTYELNDTIAILGFKLTTF